MSRSSTTNAGAAQTSNHLSQSTHRRDREPRPYYKQNSQEHKYWPAPFPYGPRSHCKDDYEMAEWYHQQRCDKINLHSDDTIVTALRHVVTLFSVTVSYPKSSAHLCLSLIMAVQRTGSTPTTAPASAGYRASVNTTRAQVVLPRCQRKSNYPENVSRC